MKAILKTMPTELKIRVDEKFTSKTNADILRELVPRLISSLKPRFNPTFRKIERWLISLHKHRRARYLYDQHGVLDRDNRRIHKNSRNSEVKLFVSKLILLILVSKLILPIFVNFQKKVRRVKAATSLFESNDERVGNYDRDELMKLLMDNRYHSPEESITGEDTDPNRTDNKRKIHVYNPSWRSEEVW